MATYRRPRSIQIARCVHWPDSRQPKITRRQICFQSRFASVAMDEAHLMTAVCYVNLNPVRARLVSRAEDWPWSSARAHLAGVDDNLVIVRPVLDRTSCFADLLLQDRAEDFAALRRSEGSGRPLGTAEFVTGLERLLGRPIARRSPGPKPANRVDGEQLDRHFTQCGLGFETFSTDDDREGSVLSFSMF